MRKRIDTRGTRRRLATPALALVLVSVLAPAAKGSLRPVPGLVTNGTVSAMAQLGHRLYVGGVFSHIGVETGSGVAFLGASQRLARGFPHLDGEVTAAVSDGHGGFYVAGGFHQVGAVRRSGLVRLRGDGALDPRFHPQVRGRITMLALGGGLLFAAGSGLGGYGTGPQPLLALDPVDGALKRSFTVDQGPWVPPLRPVALASVVAARQGPPIGHCRVVLDRTPRWFRSWPISAITASGGRLYLAGSFKRVDGVARDGLAAIDLGSRTVDPVFDPMANNPAGRPGDPPWRFADALAVDANRLIVGAAKAGRGFSERVVALDADTGAVQKGLEAYLDGPLSALLIADGRMYAAGRFKHVNGLRRIGLAALDVRTGMPISSFDAHLDGTVSALAFSGVGLMAATDTGEPGGWRLERLGLSTGRRLRSPSSMDNAVETLASSGGRLYVGGAFNSADGSPRAGLAAIDLRTGRLDPGFHPPGHLDVAALAASSHRLYVSGDGEVPGGRQARSRGLVSLLPASGKVDRRFRARPSPFGGDVVVRHGTVYYADLDQDRVTAFDARTGARRRAFHPPDTGQIGALAASESRLYVGHDVSVGESSRADLARGPLLSLDFVTGAPDPDFVSPLRPTEDGTASVQRLDVAEGDIYVGGFFKLSRKSSENTLVALDSYTGALDRRFRRPHAPVSLIGVAHRRVYVDDYLGAEEHTLKALDLRSGRPRPGSTGRVGPGACTVAAAGRHLFVGGAFTGPLGPLQFFADLVDG